MLSASASRFSSTPIRHWTCFNALANSGELQSSSIRARPTLLRRRLCTPACRSRDRYTSEWHDDAARHREFEGVAFAPSALRPCAFAFVSTGPRPMSPIRPSRR
jgi:hypothetical protein